MRVSIGPDQGWPCNAAWQFGKHALVSRDHPKFNMSKTTSEVYRNRTLWEKTDRAKQVRMLAKLDLEGLRTFVVSNTDAFTSEELKTIDRRFVMEGLPSIF